MLLASNSHDGVVRTMGRGGEAHNEFTVYENVGTLRNPVWAPPFTNRLPFVTNDVDRGTFTDIDRDGVLDFFTVNQTAIDCYLNQGSAVSPVFSATPDPFLSISATTHQFDSVDIIDIDADGQLELLASGLDPICL